MQNNHVKEQEQATTNFDEFVSGLDLEEKQNVMRLYRNSHAKEKANSNSIFVTDMIEIEGSGFLKLKLSHRAINYLSYVCDANFSSLSAIENFLTDYFAYADYIEDNKEALVTLQYLKQLMLELGKANNKA